MKISFEMYFKEKDTEVEKEASEELSDIDVVILSVFKRLCVFFYLYVVFLEIFKI